MDAQQKSIINSVAPTTVSSVTIPPEYFRVDGDELNLRHFANALNTNADGANGAEGLGFSVKVDGTARYSDAAPDMWASGDNQQLQVIDITLRRVSSRGAILFGTYTSDAPGAATVGTGKLSGAGAIRAITSTAFRIDPAAAIVLSIEVTLSRASPLLAWHGLHDLVSGNAMAPIEPWPEIETGRDWLDNTPTIVPDRTLPSSPWVAANQKGYPKPSLGRVRVWPTAAQSATLYSIAAAFYASNVKQIKAILATPGNRCLILRYILNHECLANSATDGTIANGPPFISTGPATLLSAAGGWTWFAGHFLYKRRVQITSAITSAASGVSFTVSSTTDAGFLAGQWLCLSDDENFANAEHAKIHSVVGKTVTLSTRLYRSKSSTGLHPVNSYVAVHQNGMTGATSVKEFNWAVNLTHTMCPLDANGKRLWELYGEFAGTYYDKNERGEAEPGLTAHGIVWDSDYTNFDTPGYGTTNCDADNDGVVDRGILPASGMNDYGAGMAALNEKVRQTLDARGAPHTGSVIIGGVVSANLRNSNGIELEKVYDGVLEGGTNVPDYATLQNLIANTQACMTDNGYGPSATHGISKATNTIWTPTSSTPPSNYRLLMALACIYGFRHGTQADPSHGSGAVFPYFDEESVAIGGAGHGVPAAKTDLATIQANRGWGGEHVGGIQRFYDPDLFGAAASLIPNGGFEFALAGWIGTDCTVGRTTAPGEFHTGAAALKITPTDWGGDMWITGAHAKSPVFDLAAGQEYTLVFRVRASTPRRIQIRLAGTAGAPVDITFNATGVWQHHVVVFRTSQSYTATFLQINVGQESAIVLFDEFYLFSGGAPGVMGREFDQMFVLGNPTPTAKTITLADTWERIDGLQDPTVNDGSTIAAGAPITIPAYDGLFLVRPL